MNELRETFLKELADLYDAEKQIVQALPKMAEAASDPGLKEAFESHLEETEAQVGRLESVFELFEQPAKAKKCKGMQGLLAEGEDLIKEEEGDAALICAAQKVEHYEIAAYGSLCAWARVLGMEEAVELLEESLEEEKAADETLTEVAESTSNLEEDEDEESEGVEDAKPSSSPKRRQP
jgi:ferritin-like metal-binding protein YciE